METNSEGSIGTTRLPPELELKLESMNDKPKGCIGLPGQIDAKKSSETAGDKSNDKSKPASEAKPAADATKDPADKPEKPIELKKPTAIIQPKDDSIVPAPDAKEPVPPEKSKAPSASDQSASDKSESDKSESDKSGDKKATDKELAKKDGSEDTAAKVAELKPVSASDYRIEAAFEVKRLVDGQKGQARLALTWLTDDQGNATLLGRILGPMIQQPGNRYVDS